MDEAASITAKMGQTTVELIRAIVKLAKDIANLFERPGIAGKYHR
jgi:GTPase Era involved in 16S rRNA processing